MLKRWALVVMIGLSFANSSMTAKAEPQCSVVGHSIAGCLVSAEASSGDSDAATGAGVGVAGARSVGAGVCMFGVDAVSCESPLGMWSGQVQGWCRLMEPQPALSDSAWGGESEGAVYSCVRPNGALVPDPGLAFMRWLPRSPDGGVVTRADAEDAARRVLASMGLVAVDVGMQPRGDTPRRMTYVGWNTWLWADEPSVEQWGPMAVSASSSGIAVSLDARVTELVWDMGDGSAVTCGRGTEWSALRSGGGENVASPDCGYVYERDGYYTVTATSVWEVEWSAAGFSGVLPLALSRSREIIVGELQAVVIG